MVAIEPVKSWLDAGISVQLLPGAVRIAGEQQQAGQQPDNLCGPYWAAVLLRSHGIAVSAEQLALQAGSVLPIGDPQTWLPEGASSCQDADFPLPSTDRLSDAGTSAQGLIQAVKHQSQGAFCLLPLQTNWTAERVTAVLALCRLYPETVPLCNLRTGHLWGSQLTVAETIAYLNGQPIVPPPADWDVGHFLMLAGQLVGQSQSLLLVCDTYPLFGWQGYHVQPAVTIAASLNRNDGNQGGILLFMPAALEASVAQAAVTQGFQIAAWDNGSPIPFV